MLSTLDLFCGAGGAAQGLKQVGFNKIIGVDINNQSQYPFEFIKSDVFDMNIEYMKQFDLIWSSPPCQAYTFASGRWRNCGIEYPNLIDKTRKLLLKIKKPFVIENVTTAPIRKDLMLCGEMFGLRVIRHRIFEIHGFKVIQLPHKKHISSVRHGYYMTVAGHGGDGKGSLLDWQKAMGIDWILDRKMLVEAVPPAYSRYIGKFFINRNKDIYKLYSNIYADLNRTEYKHRPFILD